MNPEPFLISIFQLPGQVDNAGVLDIGAGNANCAMLAAGLMKLTVPDAVIGAFGEDQCSWDLPRKRSNFTGI